MRTLSGSSASANRRMFWNVRVMPRARDARAARRPWIGAALEQDRGRAVGA